MHPRADASAGFRAGWARLARFVGPKLHQWEERWFRAMRENDRLKGRVGSLLREVSRLIVDERGRVITLTPLVAWRRLRDMQHVVATQPAIARAVRCLSLYDQLDLTLELLHQRDWPDFDPPEDLPPNVIPFRRRHG